MSEKPWATNAKCPGSGQQGTARGSFYVFCPSCNRSFNRRGEKLTIPLHTSPRPIGTKP